MNRKNQRGAGMAAILRVRLPPGVPDAIRELVAVDQQRRNDICWRMFDFWTGVTLVVSPRCRSGAAHVQNVIPNADVLRGRLRHNGGSARGYHELRTSLAA
jgi:hypothetical protein